MAGNKREQTAYIRACVHSYTDIITLTHMIMHGQVTHTWHTSHIFTHTLTHIHTHTHMRMHGQVYSYMGIYDIHITHK